MQSDNESNAYMNVVHATCLYFNQTHVYIIHIVQTKQLDQHESAALNNSVFTTRELLLLGKPVDATPCVATNITYMITSVLEASSLFICLLVKLWRLYFIMLVVK